MRIQTQPRAGPSWKKISKRDPNCAVDLSGEPWPKSPLPGKTSSQHYLVPRTRRQTRACPQPRPRPSPQTRTPSARPRFAGTSSSHCIFPPHSTRPRELTSRPDPAETRRPHHRKSANGSDLRARPRVAVRGVRSSRSMRRPRGAILCKDGMKPKD